MYIKRLELENYRGFESLVIDFPPKANNLNVFIGINGSGKSSVLDAISLALEGFVHTFYSFTNIKSYLGIPSRNLHKDNDWSVNPDDVRINCDAFLIRAALEDRQLTIEWSISYERYFQQLALPGILSLDSQSSSEFNLSVHSQELSSYFELIGIDPEQSKPSSIADIKALPVIAYYRARRIEVNSVHAQRFIRRVYSSQLPYGESLNSFSTSSQDITFLSEWFTEEEDIENADRLRNNIEYRRPNLQIVRFALEKFSSHFSNGFFQEVQAFRTPRHLRNLRSFLTVQKGSDKLKFQQLSDGEKILLGLVLDIARRIAVFNSDASSPEKALQGQGVILIDEIDSHLHPSWQRTVLPALKATFPNCQFIVTTHSPQVISSVPSESIFVLDGGSVIHNPGYTYGRESNSILRELMGVSERIPVIQEKIKECFDLIEDEKFAEAKEKLKSLQDVLGDNDPDVIYLGTTITMFE